MGVAAVYWWQQFLAIGRGFSQCFPPGDKCFVDWAAWATVFSAIVGWLAWRTSRQAARIAAKQHLAEVDHRMATAMILGRLLDLEIRTLPARIESVIRAWDQAILKGNSDPSAQPITPSRIDDPKAFAYVMQHTNASFLPIADQVQDRIHSLPEHYGADLATLMGTGKTINDFASRIANATKAVEPMPGVRVGELEYQARPSDFDSFREILSRMHVMSEDFAKEFGSWVQKLFPVPTASQESVGALDR